MQAIVFVAAFAVCIVAAWVVLAVIEKGQPLKRELGRRSPGMPAPELDVYIPVTARPRVYDWAERGELS